MYETSTALNPVAAFEFYLSKTHPDIEMVSSGTHWPSEVV